MNYLFLRLRLQFRVNLVERKFLIIFDEVRLCPPARQAIKQLVKDRRYDYIEIGSLISILTAYHASDPNAGLSANRDLTRFKLYVCDTGLFTTLMFKGRDFTENELYENVVARQLAACGNELFYYTFPTETSRHNILKKYVVYTKDYAKDREHFYIPVYMASFL